jgi:hypothetical protein
MTSMGLSKLGCVRFRGLPAHARGNVDQATKPLKRYTTNGWETTNKQVRNQEAHPGLCYNFILFYRCLDSTACVICMPYAIYPANSSSLGTSRILHSPPLCANRAP